MKFLYKLERIDYDFIDINSEHTILFLHGWGGDKNSFLQSINLVKNQFNVFSLTLPTIKETNEVWSLFDYTELIQNILKLHNINSVIIVCHSFGFRVACLLNGIINIEKIVVTGGAGLKKKSILKRIENQNNVILLKQIRFSYLYTKIASKDYIELSKNNKQTFKNVVNTINNNLIVFNCPILLFWGRIDTPTPIWMAKKIYRINATFHNKKITKILKNDAKFIKNSTKFDKNSEKTKIFNKNEQKSNKNNGCIIKTNKDKKVKLIITNSDHFAYINMSSLFNNELLKFLKEWICNPSFYLLMH